MTVEDIAQAAHEINQAYCLSLGDDSQPDWADAPDWQKESAITGAKFHLTNLDAGPEASHNNWLEEKKKEGWKYGATKDVEKKEHPCYVVFDQLPEFQKTKDFLFRQVVHSLMFHLSPLSDYYPSGAMQREAKSE